MIKKIIMFIMVISVVTSTLIIVGIYSINQQALVVFEENEFINKQKSVDFFMNEAWNNIYILNKAHAYWSDANEALAIKDEDWIDTNVTYYLIDGDFNIDLLYLSNEDGSFTQSYGATPFNMTEKNIYTEVLVNNEEVNSLLWHNGQLYFITGMPISDDDGSNPNGVLILGRRLDEDMRGYLASIIGDIHEDHYEITYQSTASLFTEEEEIRTIFIESVDDNAYIHVHYELSYSQYIKSTIVQNSTMIVILSSILMLTLMLLVVREFNKDIKEMIHEMEGVNLFSDQKIALSYRKSAELNRIIEPFTLLAEQVRDNYQRLLSKNIEIATLLSKANEINDPYTKEHSDSVSVLSVKIGEKLGIENLDQLEMCAKLHDIGKVFIPQEILNKPGKLSKDEYNEVKSHAYFGYQLLESITGFDEIQLGVLYHHERYDGKGYPSGLHGETIPLFARIISICDVYDALTSDRPYRKAFSKERAVQMMEAESGTHFDPILLQIFFSLLDESN